jgi:hypothetical protein
MRLLIPVFSPATGTWGGLTRVIAVAEAAIEASHRVAFCAAGSLFSVLKQRGFLVYPTPPATMFGLPARLSRALVMRSQQIALPVKPGRDFGNIWFVLFLAGMARAGYLKCLVDAERRVALDFRADFIFTDLDPGAYLVALIDGLPVAAAYQTPMAKGIHSLPWMLVNRALKAVLNTYHLPVQPAEKLFHGPQVLKIIPSIPELEGTGPSQSDVIYVGHLLGDIQAGDGFHPEPGKRCIFVYLGTGAVPIQKARIVLPQIFQPGGQHTCLVGSQSITSVERIGAVEFRPYVPAVDVLPYCDWMICHGGQNTIVQSLMNDVPLLIFPGPIFERRFNARKVQETGAGLMGEVNEFNVEWIVKALEKQPACAGKAAQLGMCIRSYGGARAAVEAMQAWNPNI